MHARRPVVAAARYPRKPGDGNCRRQYVAHSVDADSFDTGDATTYEHSTRSIVALLVTVFCASAGTMAGETALGKQVFDITGRELDLGWLGLIEFAPAAILVLVTGAVAD